MEVFWAAPPPAAPAPVPAFLGAKIKKIEILEQNNVYKIKMYKVLEQTNV